MPRPRPVYIVDKPTPWLLYLLIFGGILMLVGAVLTALFYVAIAAVGIGVFWFAVQRWPKTTWSLIALGLGALGGPIGIGVALAAIAIVGVIMKLGGGDEPAADPKLLTRD